MIYQNVIGLTVKGKTRPLPSLRWEQVDQKVAKYLNLYTNYFYKWLYFHQYMKICKA